MGDFIFDQLEDLANDTFAEFEPVGFPSSPYQNGGNMSTNGSVPSSPTHQPNYYSADYVSNGSVDDMGFDYEMDQSPTSFSYGSNAQQPSSPSNQSFDGYYHDSYQQSVDMYSGHNYGMDSNISFERKQVTPILPPPIQGDVVVKDLFLQDHTGKNIDSTAIKNCVLKCHTGFFGIVFDDSFHGPSISQFYPSDIVTVVRQCDRVGVYLQFRRFLTCKNIPENLIQSKFDPNSMDDYWTRYADENMWSDSKSRFYKDSPLNTCLYILIEFYNDNQVQHLFNYIGNSLKLLECLKMVYPQWMYCAHFCTSNDVQLIYLAVQNKQFSKEIDNSVSVRASAGEITEDNAPSVFDVEKLSPSKIESRTGFIPKWAKKANSSVQVGVLTTAKQYHFKNRQTKAPVSKHSTIDFKKIELVVPPNFYNMALEVRKFCEELLVSGRILPFQLTVGLCSTLAIAQTNEAKIRAQQILKTLSKHPNVQLKNTSAIARYIISSSNESKTSSTSLEKTSPAVTSPKKIDDQQHKQPSGKTRARQGSLNLFNDIRLTNLKDGEYGKNSTQLSKSSGSDHTGKINSYIERDLGCIIA